MTLLQFIKSKLEDNTPLGDLARDAYNDKELKNRKTDKERISYLEWACRNVSEHYEDFITEFNSVNNR